MKHGKIWIAALALVGAAWTTPAVASEIDFGGMYAPGTPGVGEFVLGGTAPGKWGPAAFGTGASVTWSLMATGTSTGGEVGHGATFTALADFMPAGFLAAIQAAFNAWAAVANLTFTQVADCGAAFNTACAGGDIRIGGATFDGAFGVLAHGYFPPVNGVTAAGDIHFDTAETWKIGFGGAGFDIFQVMAHELGHALGLNHTAVANSLMNPTYTEAFSGPQADDIAGMQFIYGARQVDPAVPEPATLLLLGSGLFAAAARRRAVKK